MDIPLGQGKRAGIEGRIGVGDDLNDVAIRILNHIAWPDGTDMIHRYQHDIVARLRAA